MTTSPLPPSTLRTVLVGLGATLLAAGLLLGLVPLGSSASGWSCGSAWAPSERATNIFLDLGTRADCSARRTVPLVGSLVLVVVGLGLGGTGLAAGRRRPGTTEGAPRP